LGIKGFVLTNRERYSSHLAPTNKVEEPALIFCYWMINVAQVNKMLVMSAGIM